MDVEAGDCAVIKVHVSGRYAPLVLTLRNNPGPVPVELREGDLLVDVVNFKVDGCWLWRYVILRPIAEEEAKAA